MNTLGPLKALNMPMRKYNFHQHFGCVVDIDVDNVFDSFLGYLEDHKLDLGVHDPIAQIEHRGFSPNVELGKEKDYSSIYVFMLRSVQYCVGIINLLSILRTVKYPQNC